MFGGMICYTPDFKLPKTYIVEHGRVVDSIDNPDSGPWVVFWQRVVAREWLEEIIREHTIESDPDDSTMESPSE
jgi:hypothetical protein